MFIWVFSLHVACKIICIWRRHLVKRMWRYLLQGSVCIWRGCEVRYWGCDADLSDRGSAEYTSSGGLHGFQGSTGDWLLQQTQSDAGRHHTTTLRPWPHHTPTLVPKVNCHPNLHHKWFHDGHSGSTWETYTWGGKNNDKSTFWRLESFIVWST